MAKQSASLEDMRKEVHVLKRKVGDRDPEEVYSGDAPPRKQQRDVAKPFYKLTKVELTEKPAEKAALKGLRVSSERGCLTSPTNLSCRNSSSTRSMRRSG